MSVVSVVCDDANIDPLALRAGKAELMPLSRLLELCGYALDEAAGELRRTHDGIPPAGLLDRVVEVSPATVATLDRGTGLLHRGQVSWAYQHVLRQAGLSRSAGAAYSTVGKLVPLTTQWRMVRAALPGVATPDFVHGYGPEVIEVSHLHRPIFTTPFNAYRWKPNERPEGIPIDHFAVDAPEGRPLLAYKLGSTIRVHALDSDAAPPSVQTCDRIASLAAVAAELFSAECGESIWFEQEEKVTFGGFSLALVAAVRQPGFAEAADDYLAGLATGRAN